MGQGNKNAMETKRAYQKPKMRVVDLEPSQTLLQASAGGIGYDIPLQVNEERFTEKELLDIW